jgi:hypothetical protein
MVARGGHGAHPGHPQTALEGSRNYGLRLIAMRCVARCRKAVMGDHDKERLRIRLKDQRVRMLMMNPSGECVLEVSLAVEPAGWS